MERGRDDRPGHRPEGSRGKPKSVRAASIDDLDDEPVLVRSEPREWTDILGGIAILAAVAVTVWFPADQITEAVALAVALSVAIWYFRPGWLPLLRVGVAAVFLAACARYGHSVFVPPGDSAASRKADETREVRRGDAHLKQRLQRSGGF